MSTIFTSLHAGYQPNLDLVWALRELGANAVDGEKRNAHLGKGSLSFDYSSRTKTVTISNESVTVPLTALLMGTSDSREEVDCIGQFGEGLPMALLVLSRLRYSVEIYNGAEKWTPSIEEAEDYGGEQVLAVKVRKLRKDRNAFTVVVKGVAKSDYEEMLTRFLMFDPMFDEQETVVAAGKRVLLDPRYRGKLYVKGVYVAERSNLLFGYDLASDLNRDRSAIDDVTLAAALDTLFFEISPGNTAPYAKFEAKIAAGLLDNPNCLESQDRYSNLYYLSSLRSKLADGFKTRYGLDAIPACESREIKEAKAMGLNPIVVSPFVHRCVSTETGTLAQIRSNREKQRLRSYDESELTDLEKANLRRCIILAKIAMPDLKNLPFCVVDFVGEVSFVVDLSKTNDAISVSVSRTLLDRFNTLLPVIVDASKEALSLWGSNQDQYVAIINALVGVDNNDCTFALELAAT